MIEKLKDKELELENHVSFLEEEMDDVGIIPKETFYW